MRRHLARRSLRKVVTTACGAALVATLACVDVSPAQATATPPPGVQLGVYTNPGAKGVAGARAFSAYSGAPVTRVLDFLAHTTWLDMTRIGWALNPYGGQGLQLELSVPMIPNESGVSLAACAAGSYDTFWRSIATSVMNANLPTTEIRPGWEMNGNWFNWSSIGRTADYAGCFRSMVTAMRSVPGQQFSFAFSPAAGAATAPAVDAYPGDAYVDDISPDLYDQSWAVYPTPAGWTAETARAKAWSYTKSGTGGLDFWSAFAKTHGKPLAFSEWGLSWRSDGHGGGDDAAFVDHMFDYITDPANNVKYSNYFNSPDSADLKHDIMRSDTVFPLSSARFAARSAATTQSPAAGVGGSPATPASPTVPTTPASPTTPATPVTPTVPATPTPAASPTLKARPVVNGRAVLRHRLRATPGRWLPAAQTTRYRWFRGAHPIPGARARVYRVRRADVGRRIRVRVTMRRTGFLTTPTWTRYTAHVSR